MDMFQKAVRTLTDAARANGVTYASIMDAVLALSGVSEETLAELFEEDTKLP